MRIAKSVTSPIGILAAIALLGGCSSNAGSALPQSGPAQRSAEANARAGSWMSPDAKNIGLLYVADLNDNDVKVYSYPGGRLKGTLTGFSVPHSECVDQAGNVFVANGGKNQLVEYAHGGTSPIKIYHEPGFTHGCAVDPTTGNLAVLHDPPSSGPGGISIYAHAKGKPAEYTTPNVFRVYFLGYDDKGNLFVDGTDFHVAFELAELPARGKTAEAITLNQSIVLPGAIAWDGQHLAVGDQVSISGPSKIYEFSMSGSMGTLSGTTDLRNSCDVLQFWIQGKRVIAANDCRPAVMYFDYPSGGLSTKTISNSLSQPVGVTVSLK
jgi:hypothetical protein